MVVMFLIAFIYLVEVIRQRLLNEGWLQIPRARSDGPAQVFTHPDYQGEIGLIMPYEKTSVSPLLTVYAFPAIGNLHLCLFGENGDSFTRFIG